MHTSCPVSTVSDELYFIEFLFQYYMQYIMIHASTIDYLPYKDAECFQHRNKPFQTCFAYFTHHITVTHDNETDDSEEERFSLLVFKAMMMTDHLESYICPTSYRLIQGLYKIDFYMNIGFSLLTNLFVTDPAKENNRGAINFPIALSNLADFSFHQLPQKEKLPQIFQ